MKKTLFAIIALVAFCGNLFGETFYYVCNTGKFIDWLDSNIIRVDPSGNRLASKDWMVECDPPLKDEVYFNPEGIEKTAELFLEDFYQYAYPKAGTDLLGNKNSFIIAGHSQGGIVARRVLQLAANDPRFAGVSIKGYVESCAPNQGSRLADKVWVKEGVKPLVKLMCVYLALNAVMNCFIAPVRSSMPGEPDQQMPLDSLLDISASLGRGATGDSQAMGFLSPLFSAETPRTVREFRGLMTREGVERTEAGILSGLQDLFNMADGLGTDDRNNFIGAVLDDKYDSMDDLIPGNKFMTTKLNATESIATEMRYARASIMSNDDNIYDAPQVWSWVNPLYIANYSIAAAATLTILLCGWWYPQGSAAALLTLGRATLNICTMNAIPTKVRYLAQGNNPAGSSDIIVPYNDFYGNYVLSQRLVGGAQGIDYERTIPRLTHICGDLEWKKLHDSSAQKGKKATTADEIKTALKAADAKLLEFNKQ